VFLLWILKNSKELFEQAKLWLFTAQVDSICGVALVPLLIPMQDDYVAIFGVFENFVS